MCHGNDIDFLIVVYIGLVTYDYSSVSLISTGILSTNDTSQRCNGISVVSRVGQDRAVSSFGF